MPDDTHSPIPPGFAAGTLVHTKEGLKPIETIQVGDWVLSADESGIKPYSKTYKRVTRTLTHHDREVILLSVIHPREKTDPFQYSYLVLTPEFPVCRSNHPGGWLPARLATKKNGYCEFEIASVSDGKPAETREVTLLFASGKSGVARHIAKKNGIISKDKPFVQINPVAFCTADIFPELPVNKINKDEIVFKATVYNLELEDCYTYFVSEAGVWAAAENSSNNIRINGIEHRKWLKARVILEEKKLAAEAAKSKSSSDPASNTFGFGAGTLVHTKEGLKPIETIQVGDWVLSKHESGEGEREYKQVTRTFVHEEREVNLLSIWWSPPSGGEFYCRLAVTPEHPIWVNGKRWKAAGKLIKSSPNTYVESLHSEKAEVVGNVCLFATEQPGVAWRPTSHTAYGLSSVGSFIEVKTFRYLGAAPPPMSFSRSVVDLRGAADTDYSPRLKRRARSECLYRTTVYNFEVEDFHTYYVGEAGIWVKSA